MLNVYTPVLVVVAWPRPRRFHSPAEPDNPVGRLPLKPSVTVPVIDPVPVASSEKLMLVTGWFETTIGVPFVGGQPVVHEMWL